MRVIKSDSGFLAYNKIFKHLVGQHSKLVLWQFFTDSQERKISSSYVNSFHPASGLFHCDLPQENVLEKVQPVYCYSEEGQFIFKTGVQEIQGNVLSLTVPPEIQILEEAEVALIRGQIGIDLSEIWRVKRFDVDAMDTEADVMVVKSMAERTARDQEFLAGEFESLSLDQEDKIFAGKRESPRARPKNEKWVKLKVGQLPEIHLVKLFDLSQGGLGFLTGGAQKFPKGSDIQVVGFLEFDLDDPLIGVVMSHRPTDDSMVEYKIGVKFNDGQA